MKNTNLMAVALMSLGLVGAARAQFSPQVGEAGFTAGVDAIERTDARFTGWATGGSVVRGPQDISNPNSPLASFGVIGNAFGPASASATDVVSLGDGGSADVGRLERRSGMVRGLTCGVRERVLVWQRRDCVSGTGLCGGE